MRYLLLIYQAPPVGEPSPEAIQEEMGRYYAFTAKESIDRGFYLGGEALEASNTATTVRVRNGQTLTTDGPFAETKEELGGYYLLECPDLDAAIEMAAMIPTAERGSVEIRPIWEVSNMAVQEAGIAAGSAAGYRPGASAPVAGASAPDARASAPVARASAPPTHEVVDRLFREDAGRAVATLIRVLGDFDLAEEAVQEAFVVALERWPVHGVPDNPGAWITTTARNRAIDRIRRARRLVDKTEELGRRVETSTPAPQDELDLLDMDPIPDDRLRLIFTCCHPALAPDAQVALTLRTLGGLTTPEIARAFLVPEPTLAQRLVRAKKKIRTAGIPYRVPPEHLLPERLDAVLHVLYLIFNEGYSASSGDALIRRDLSGEAIRLARVLMALMPDEPEAIGLLALMLLHDARRDARVGPAGELVLLSDQDRSRWDGVAIAEGRQLVEQALIRHRPGPYQLQAAIAAIHDEASSAAETDWRQIAALYGVLADVAPSPVVELNRSVAVAMAFGPQEGLLIVERVAATGALEQYHLLHATRADLLRRVGRRAEAAAAYRLAREVATNEVERAFLTRRLGELEPN